MSAINEREISLIKDEDLLKKMWQETEDFGKKKEIRSHMYKLREARLKDLYNTSDVKDVQISTNTKTSFNQSTHADSLADHSFASLKSKEIRDSESPTRDVSYRITGSTNNKGWNVSKIDERSEDGKTHKIIKSAETSGSEVIPKGKLDFDAKSQQEVTSFQDGDDKNFVRSQALSSNTMVRQEAVGGDENSSFKTSSTKSSSSSKTVTEQKVSYDDTVDYISNKQVPSDQQNVVQKSVKVYATDAPKELKNHPGYVEGRTKITRETKTLADGTVVTTTKYETTGANEIKSSSTNQHTSSNSTLRDNKSNFTSSSSHGEKYSNQKISIDSENVPTDQSPSRSRYYVEKTHTIPDNSDNTYQNVQSSRTTNVHHQTFGHNERKDDSTSKRYINSDSTNDTISREHTEDVKRTSRQEIYQENVKNENASVRNRTESAENKIVNTGKVLHNTTLYQDINSVPLGTPIEIEIDVSRMDIGDKRRTINETTRKQSDKFISKSPENVVHDTPQKKESIKPTESEWKTKTKPTSGQYDTTYKTDYTNKKISVELSPTHDAFARSLRAVSPDRLSSRSSSRNLKNSNSSLRSSSSPEKSLVDQGQTTRISPERQRYYSPTKKTPDRLSSTETITYKSRPSIERAPAQISQKIKHTTESRVKTSHSDTINRKKSLENTSDVFITTKSTRLSPTKSPSRSSITNKPEHYRTTHEITTDLDDNISTISNTTVTKTERLRPTTLEYSTTKTEEVMRTAQKSSPTNISLKKDNLTKDVTKKDKPVDRPLKRSDTYEERCRQILGITNETTERRRSSLEKLKRRGSANSTHPETFSKVTSDQQPKVTPTKRDSPTKQSPQSKEQSPRHEFSNRQKSPLQEFPAQIRRSPEKSQKYCPESTIYSVRKSPDRQQIQEFPSQIRTSPDKTKSTDRKSPLNDLSENLKHKYPKKNSEPEIVQKVPSKSRKSPEDVSDMIIPSRELPKDIVNKKNLPREDISTKQLADSVTNECSTIDSSLSTKKIYEVSIDNDEGEKVAQTQKTHQKQKSPQTLRTDELYLTEKVLHHQEDEINDMDLITQKHTNKNTSVTKGKLIDDVVSITETLTQKSIIPKTPTTRETSPLKEYPSQSREKSEIDEVNSSFIKHKSTIRPVPSEGYTPLQTKISSKGKKTNTSEILVSRETGEDVSSKITVTEIADKYTPEKKVSKERQPKIYEDSTPQDNNMSNYLDQKYVTKKLESDVVSTIDSTVTTEKHSETKSSPRNLITEPSSTPSEQNDLKRITKNELQSNTNDIRITDTHKVEKIARNEQRPTSENLSHTENLNYHQNPKSNESHPSRQTDTSVDITVLTTDIVYINGDNCERSIGADKTITTEPVLRNHSVQNDVKTETAVLMTKRTSVKENIPEKSKNHKHPPPKDQSVLKTSETKRNERPSKEKPLETTSEPKPALIKKIPTSKHVPKIHDKPSLKTTDQPSKKSTPSQNSPKKMPNIMQNGHEKIKLIEQPEAIVDSEDTSEGEIEEIHKKKYVNETYEGRIPVEEPLVIRKTVSLLYSDDEDDKKNTQMLIESEIIDKQPITDNKKPRSEKTPKITTSKFISNEKKDINSKIIQSPSKSSPKFTARPAKKPLIETNQNKSKLIGETEYTDKYNRKSVHSKYVNNQTQNTISDIENFENLKNDTSPHTRFHRISDTVTKTKNSTQKTKDDEKITKIVSEKPSPSKVTSSVIPKSKTSSQTKRVVEKPVQTVKTKSNEPIQNLSKVAKPSTKQKHVVSTTILLKPKVDTATVKTVSSKKNYSSKTIQSATVTKNVVEPDESDEDSIPDSLNEHIRDSSNKLSSVNHTKTRISKSTLNRNIVSPERKTPSRHFSKPDFIEDKPKTAKPKLEKRCISTKSIIINNTDRGITVDLQRSISSREPTPDRVCPLPVTSDDDGVLPRFPDKVVEPDDHSANRNSNRLFQTIILENDDGKEVQRIVEITEDINQKVTDVDKVDRDDDSLLTVNKKISKFLTTADKLTEKPIIDISQPAPKVERPKFEVTEDLKEDDCLMSVSDKVNKFINEAEYLTSQTNSQPRKSVNIDIKADVSKKVNTVTSTQEPKLDQTSPAKVLGNKYIKDDVSSKTSNKVTEFVSVVDEFVRPVQKESRRLSKQDQSTIQQDVFITTERDQIEKEEDSFRTSKHPSESVHTQQEPKCSTKPTDISQARVSDFRPYSRQSKSPETNHIKRVSPARKLSTETTSITRKECDSFIKNQEKLLETPRNKKLPEDEPFRKFTPKNRRPSQEEKVILSTVGRLRSSESIKKAKAIFENGKPTDKVENTGIASRRILIEENNKNSKEISNFKKPIDKSNLTPKRLDFLSNDESTVTKTSNTFDKLESISSKTKIPDDIPKSDEKNLTSPDQNLPGYMRPVHRSVRQQSPQKEELEIIEIDEYKHERNKEKEIPGYMKPLERSTRPHSPQEEHMHESSIHRIHQSRVSIDTEEIPGYMKPLDRSLRPHSPERDNIYPYEAHDKQNFEKPSEELPGYMKPLKSHNHQNEYLHSCETDQSSESRKFINSREIPGYMKPLESHMHTHTSHESKVSRVDHQKSQLHSSRIRDSHEPTEYISTNEVPGYMKPITPHNHQREDLHTSEAYHSHEPREAVFPDEIPGYMRPITSHSHQSEYLQQVETDHIHEPRGSIPTDKHPGYMKPLMSQNNQRENIHPSESHHSHEPRGSLPTDDLPGYMKPRISHRHQQDHSHESETHHSHEHRGSLPTDELPGYMKPLISHSRPKEHLHESEPRQNYEPRRSIPRDELPGYMKPLKSHKNQKDNLHTLHSHESRVSIPTDELSNYKTSQHSTARAQSPHKDHPSRLHDTQYFTEPLSVEELPGYMRPIDRANKPHSPKSEHVGTPTKFGVTLKRTDSSKGVTSINLTSTTTKKHPILSKKNITEEEIEQIYELEVLEELLLVITGYELRKQIRAQIRTVKKLISENKLELTIQKISNKDSEKTHTKETRKIDTTRAENKGDYNRKTSPQRKLIDNKHDGHTVSTSSNEKTSEYASSFTRKESTGSFTKSGSPSSRASKSPERRSPERKSPSRFQSEDYVIHTNVSDTRPSTDRNSLKKIPQEQVTKTTNIFKSSLKKTEPKTKAPITNGQPEWASQRNLKNVSSDSIVKKATVSTSSTRSVKQQTARSSSPTKDAKPTDVITSSYGVGPTDENGTPLFGLKALRAQNKSINTKVQGTVVSSQYYSETGKEPVGQISVTKYSSDPRDLGSNENLNNEDEGIVSITTTQKFGFDDAPSLKQLTNTKRDICDVQSGKKTSTSKSSTITRRNSVKALTQKFVENAVETSKNEQQSSYPKAGLILRSSSFKNDSTLDTSDDYDEITAEQRTVTSTNSRVISGGTFLRNKSKVTGIQDVVTRMKAEDVETGDTPDDIEARGLLNKYLGSQTILSGIEGQISKTTTSTAKAASSRTSVKSTTKVTTVIMENGKEVKKTRIFEHPIPNEVLETVWDEQTLRYLLDQSTDYEERKRIRARLRLIMAEQEACTELVKQASQDQSGQSVDETIETNREIVTEGPVTTTNVTTSRVTTHQQMSKKPISPFAKFRQLDKQNSLNTPPSTPRTPGGSPLFKFTDAALSQSASTIKDRLLFWCRMKTKEYENIQLDNFSSSWADGLAFCALIHHFLPNSFDYHVLTPKERRHNFTLAFKVADEKADIAPLLDVDDMVATRKPDWKCVFTYVQSIYRRFKDED